VVHPGHGSPARALSGPSGDARHVPVLLDQVLALAGDGPHRTVVDGTLGLGGHAEALLERFRDLELYVGLDRDPQALARATTRLARFEGRLRLAHATFDRAGEVLDAAGVRDADFILLDLGVSSFQLDTAERGFSFMHEGPLDMRMDPTQGPTALELIQRLPVKELEAVLKEGGEVTCAGRVAKALHENRQRMRTTADLARVVTDALPAPAKRGLKIHPATTTFMALRVAVNRELEMLAEALPALIDRLAPGGRIAVIAFHSLEDRIVKQALAREAKGCVCPPQFPICTCGKKPRIELVDRKAFAPKVDEVDANPRSRSAKLRVGMRV
jgi:16S rRNA (cytosine1402-N4)-methyltransferase